MPFNIQCSNPKCGAETYARNITALMREHVQETTTHAGLFLCTECSKATGYVQKKFKLQETEKDGSKELWNPILRGVVKINDPLLASGNRAEGGPSKNFESSYQPFVLLVSYAPTGPIEDFWFSYYKDTRNEPKGRLKLGHGPGGPPVLTKEGVIGALCQLVSLRLVSGRDLEALSRAMAG